MPVTVSPPRNFRRSTFFTWALILPLGLSLTGCEKNRSAGFEINNALPDPDLVEYANETNGEPSEWEMANSFDADAYRADLDYMDKAQARLRNGQSNTPPTENRVANNGDARQPVDRTWSTSEERANMPLAREERDVIWESTRSQDHMGNTLAADSVAVGFDADSGNLMDANRGGISAVDRRPSAENRLEPSLIPPTMDISSVQVLMDQVLRKEASGSNSPLREYLGVVALSLADPSRRIDVNRLYDLSDSERTLLAAYQDHFISVGRGLENTDGIDSLTRDIQKFAARAGATGSIRLDTFKACTDVANYGSYDEIEKLRFVRGYPVDLVAYAEISNFRSVLGADDQFHTRIKFEIELYTQADGVLVYSIDPATVHDTCRNYRRDFFLASVVHLPANLAQGRYSLKVRVTDQQARSSAESVLPIEIVAQ